MKPKLFVGNLSFETTDEELKKLFAPYGEIESAVVIVDRRSGKSKGYGFVQMVESKDAAKALEISGQEFMGRDIVVTEAESPGEGESRRRRKGGGNNRGRYGNNRGGNRKSTNRRYGNKDNSSDTEKKSFWQKLVGIFSPKKEEPKKTSRPRGNRSGRSRNSNSGSGNRNRSNRSSRGGQRRSYTS